MAGRIIELAILAISVSAFLQNTAAQITHVVGDELGWFLPPRGPIAYDTWASLQTFSVGDILVFNFINEEQDVAQVTNEAYKTCNSTNPISLKATSPANFSLHSPGDYYFISSFDRHCLLGQKLAISVPASSPQPSPAVSPRGPITYTVGDELGWLVPPAAEIAYHKWAFGNTFIVGDTLVFQYINGAQDVAEVNKEAHENCETKKAIAVYASSPTRIILNSTGEHFYTSTYSLHCALDQKLAINFTARSSSASSPESSLSPSSLGPSANGPASAPPLNSESSKIISGYIATFVVIVIALAFFY